MARRVSFAMTFSGLVTSYGLEVDVELAVSSVKSCFCSFFIFETVRGVADFSVRLWQRLFFVCLSVVTTVERYGSVASLLRAILGSLFLSPPFDRVVLSHGQWGSRRVLSLHFPLLS